MPVEVQTLLEWEQSGVAGMLSVVIPAHNEEGHIAETVTAITTRLADENIQHEVLVINDNSEDRTPTILAELTRRYPAVRYIDNDAPNGFGFAVRRGLAAFRGDAVAIVMADGSDVPEDLVAFYRKMNEGYDCVFGSRFASGAQVDGYPWLKLVLNRMGNKFIQLLFRISNNDISNAFKMYRRSVIAGLQPLLANHFNLTVELPLKAIVRGYSYATVPNGWRNRREGRSKFKIKEMGSRYFFIVFYCWLERSLTRNDYHVHHASKALKLQVWPR